MVVLLENVGVGKQVKVLTKSKFGGLLKKVAQVGEMVNFRNLDEFVLMSGVQVEIMQATEIAFGFPAK
jgi:hypothetical protein